MFSFQEIKQLLISANKSRSRPDSWATERIVDKTKALAAAAALLVRECIYV